MFGPMRMEDVVEVIAPEAHQQRRRHDMRATARRPMTAEEFLYAYQGVEGRWELVDGEPRLMSGGTIRHGRIARNLLSALATKLLGAKCQPFGSDVGINVNLYKVRYPDVSILCDPRDIEVDELQQAHFPSVLIEVFSPSTTDADRGQKLVEYKRLPTVQTVVHIDPETETIELYERMGPGAWQESTLQRGEALTLSSIGITLSALEMFRRP